MPSSSRPTPQKPRPQLLLRDYTLPDQGELQVITNAIHAALEYSPLMTAPRDHQDVYAYVARRIEEKFWTDVYVDRPEMRDIIYTLETGTIAVITGERGTGKSTALQAIMQELTESPSPFPDREPPPHAANLIPYVFDANQFTESMFDRDSVAETMHREVYGHLRAQLRDPEGWQAYLHEKSLAFEEFQNTLEGEGVRLSGVEEWRYFGSADEYREVIKAGTARFAAESFRDKLPFLIKYVGERTPYEPLVIIDNVDHLDNDVVGHCGFTLAAMVQSSSHRVRGAIAVRPENADLIQQALDTLPRPRRIPMSKRPMASHTAGGESPIAITQEVMEKRFAVLKERETIERLRRAIDPEKASHLAAELSEASVGEFLDHVLELVDLMVYDIFRTDEKNPKLKDDNWEFATAIHSWHNGSLRECGLSLTIFASDILQDKTHTYQLRGLLESVEANRASGSGRERLRLRRVARSLLYRHLLFWATHDAEQDRPRPLKNVMVFEGAEEDTDPPLHFLRLRVLQYLANRDRGRAAVGKIYLELGELGAEQVRIEQALRELAKKRTHDDVGLVRIDGFSDADDQDELKASAKVQLLDAGRFLAMTLYKTTEYLFWSALNTEAAFGPARIPREVTSDDIQDDSFRSAVATRFLERYLVAKFRDEHPYIRGFNERWTPAVAKRRLGVYEELFGFSKGKWFLNLAANSIEAFVRGGNLNISEVKLALDRVRKLAHSLDTIADARTR